MTVERLAFWIEVSEVISDAERIAAEAAKTGR
jgi:hypothetical protein